MLAVSGKGTEERHSAANSIDELAQLAGAAGARVVGSIVQPLDAPSTSHYVGKGKLQELVALKEEAGYDVLLLDDELSPTQQRNLEEALKVKVIDRAALILDIFARRARTHEGRLQVELAQYEYLLPRLAGQWRHLERLGGGIGTRGPGESQLETDRRLLRRRITVLKQKTEEVRQHRSLYRQKRQKSGIPVVALVGYTSAGKSTLLNALCKADVYADAKLFATLDPTTRRLTLPNHQQLLLTDTVGFIRKLPPTIVNAFRATLEELSEAALLLHVVDFSSPDAAGQCETVEDILKELGLEDKPRITVLNKIDRLLEPGEDWGNAAAALHREDIEARDDTILVSATERHGLDRLMNLIAKNTGRETPENFT